MKKKDKSRFNFTEDFIASIFAAIFSAIITLALFFFVRWFWIMMVTNI